MCTTQLRSRKRRWRRVNKGGDDEEDGTEEHALAWRRGGMKKREIIPALRGGVHQKRGVDR